MTRIVLSVFVGFAVWSLLWLTANASSVVLVPEAYNEDGSTDSAFLLLVFLILSFAFSIGSGFLTAALARTRSLAPTWTLGGLLSAVGLLVAIQYWETMPLWYHIPFLALLIPGVLVGAKIRIEKMNVP